MFFGFLSGFLWICECLGTPFSLLTSVPLVLKPILTFSKGRNWLLWLNDISPHLASPEGEGQILLLPDYQSVIDIQGNQLLPYGGEREGADVHWLRKRECHKHSQIHENPDRNPITIYQLLLPYKIRMQGGQLLHNIVQIHVAV